MDCNSMKASYLIHQFYLLPCDVRSIFERHRTICGHFRDMRQPNLEKSDLDKYQLIILREFTKARHPFCEFHDPLNRRCHPRCELLPEPNSLRLNSLGCRRGCLWILRTCRLSIYNRKNVH